MEPIQNIPNKLWFKRKTYGWGWAPATWEGWLVLAIYLVLVAVFALTLDEASTGKEIMFTFVIPLTLLSVTLLRICYNKGEAPKWQWGKDHENQ